MVNPVMGSVVVTKRRVYGDSPGDWVEKSTRGVIISDAVINSEAEQCFVILFTGGMCIDLTFRDMRMVEITTENIYSSIKNIDSKKLIEKVKSGQIKL